MRASNAKYIDGTAANIDPQIDAWNNVNRKAYKEIEILRKYAGTHLRWLWKAEPVHLKPLLGAGLKQLPEPYGNVIWQHYAIGGHANSFKALAAVYGIHYKTLERTAHQHLQTLRRLISGVDCNPEMLAEDDADIPELPDPLDGYTEGNEPEGDEHVWLEHRDSRKLRVWHAMGRYENRKLEAWYANQDYPVQHLDAGEILHTRTHEVYATDQRFHVPVNNYDRSTEAERHDALITASLDYEPELTPEETAVYDTLRYNALTEWPTKYANQGLTEKGWYEVPHVDKDAVRPYIETVFTPVEFPERFRVEMVKVSWQCKCIDDWWSDDLNAQRWHVHTRGTQILRYERTIGETCYGKWLAKPLDTLDTFNIFHDA